MLNSNAEQRSTLLNCSSERQQKMLVGAYAVSETIKNSAVSLYHGINSLEWRACTPGQQHLARYRMMNDAPTVPKAGASSRHRRSVRYLLSDHCSVIAHAQLNVGAFETSHRWLVSTCTTSGMYQWRTNNRKRWVQWKDDACGLIFRLID